MHAPRDVRVLINPRSGTGVSLRVLLDTFQQVWDCEGRTISYQFSKSAEDGRTKALRAMDAGADTLIVVGGDGMINSIGSVMINTGVALGVIPTGSGNGFARHFNIPLAPSSAIKALARGKVMDIDVGRANGHPFFVTCSMAWDAAIVKSFEKSPVRGILPYIFAAAYELFDYQPERFRVSRDGAPPIDCDQPMLFTVANLTQYGGGAKIAPHACANDGYLWLTYALKADVPRLIPMLPKLWGGQIQSVPQIHSERFRTLLVERESPGPVQVDGELLDAPARVEVDVLPNALRVLTP